MSNDCGAPKTTERLPKSYFSHKYLFIYLNIIFRVGMEIFFYFLHILYIYFCSLYLWEGRKAIIKHGNA